MVDATARTAGVLLVSATTASLVGTALLGPVLGGSDVLAAVAEHQQRVLWGALLGVLAAFFSAGIAMALYPALRPHSHGLALGAVGFRVLEAGLYVVGALGPLLLVGLSQGVVRGEAVPAQARVLATTLESLRHQAGMTGALAFYVGGGMYYLVLHRSLLIPRWLADWGVCAVVLGFVAGVLVLLRVTVFGSPLMLAMTLPIFLQELVMAGWLLVRGLAPPADLRQEDVPVTAASR